MLIFRYAVLFILYHIGSLATVAADEVQGAGNLFEGFPSLLAGECNTVPDGCFDFEKGWIMHNGTAGTTDCRETCIIYPSVRTDLTCGTCAEVGDSPAPSPTPVQLPIAVINSVEPSVSTSISPVPSQSSSPSFNPSATATSPSAIPVQAPLPTKNPTILPSQGPFKAITKRPTKLPSQVPTLPPRQRISKPPTRVPVPSLFDITLDFDEASVPTADQADFVAAAKRWEQVIIGDVEDVPIQELAVSQPGPVGCRYPTETGFVDDLYVCVYYEQIPGNVIGQGGYIYTRGNGIPVSGFVQIDPDAIVTARELGYFNALLLHEFGHALGLGSGTEACPSNSMTSMANIEYQKISRCDTTIPVEPDCGHYSEECLGTELMTPIISIGDSPLSRITVGWANDIGYEVNYTAADTFNSSQLGSIAGCNCNRRLRTTTRFTQPKIGNTRFLGHQVSVRNHMDIQSQTIQQRKQSAVPNLSLEGYKTAVDWGLVYLSEQKMKRINIVGQDSDKQQGNETRNSTASNSSSFGSSVTYVGDQFVWVYIRENGNIFSVLVRP